MSGAEVSQQAELGSHQHLLRVPWYGSSSWPLKIEPAACYACLLRGAILKNKWNMRQCRTSTKKANAILEC